MFARAIRQTPRHAAVRIAEDKLDPICNRCWRPCRDPGAGPIGSEVAADERAGRRHRAHLDASGLFIEATRWAFAVAVAHRCRRI
jgi:hypothetical protein